MNYLGLNEIRKLFLDFFESKGHYVGESSSLVPVNDNSLLLINSGMAPLKAYFMGTEEPPNTKMATCQKCIRTGDLENTGITARHGTFFEMLGNFSFGDYFKKEATAWAYEFCQDIIKLPMDRVWISVYEEDNEAIEIWVNHVGFPRERIVKLGKADNFWEHGTGPCGPCSELYFDRGEKYGCGSPDCKVGCECDRFIEFWNLVFTQFDKQEDGTYEKLAKPNIDTGMGLERLATICQEVDNIFMVDTIKGVLDEVCNLSGKAYGADNKADISIRIITDHIRSITFMLSDGVYPSNEGRGYVLRRLLRRAKRNGMKLGINKDFLPELAEKVIRSSSDAYPNLTENKEYILKVLEQEEENFTRTIENGIAKLEEYLDNSNNKKLSGEMAFKLHDTYGLPIDITKEILAEKGYEYDHNEFEKLLTEQKERARLARGETQGWDEKQEEEKKEESKAHARAHSATHLLHSALRNELGTHVFQKGSFVGEDELKFDISHYEAISPEKLAIIEKNVNKSIMSATPVDISTKSLAEAKDMGAMALFSEKYVGDVRVVKMGDISCELCSGRHVENTGNIGGFKILSESSSSSGVRRIEAITGHKMREYISELENKLVEEKHELELVKKEHQQEIKKIKQESINNKNVDTDIIERDGIKIAKAYLETDDIDVLKTLADNLKSQADIILVGGGDKLIVSSNNENYMAGNIMREITAKYGGRGGGKPQFAQGGGIENLEEAIKEF